MDTDAIVSADLSQRYGKHTVLNGLSFRVPSGKITGLLGPNGAGKTTLLKTIIGLYTPASGSVSVLGNDMGTKKTRRQAQARLSFLPQDFSADGALTVAEFVEYNLWMRTYPKEQIHDAAAAAIADVGLTDSTSQKLRTLSGGMRQRAGIAAAIAGTPGIIVLDEPTSGLDPEQRTHFRKLLAGIDSTIILSTHLIEDVESSAHHLLVLSKGTLVYDGSPAVLIEGNDRSVAALEARYIDLLQRA